MNRLLALACLIVIGCAGCGSDTPPGPTAPTIAQVAGVWTGNITQTSVSGGECVGSFVQASNGAIDHYTVTIAQAGAALTGSATSQSSGQTCSYAGTAGSNTITFNVTTCQSTGFRVSCSNGVTRDIYLNSRNFTASVVSNSLTGTVGESWNVYAAGTTTNPIAAMTVSYTATLSH